MAKSWAPEGLNLEDTVWSGVNGDVGIYVGRVRALWVWAGGMWRLSRASLPAGEHECTRGRPRKLSIGTPGCVAC